jgi:hypothetical protein
MIFDGYNTVMSLAKSKMISSTPDYFVCAVNNSSNLLRATAGVVASGAG